MDSWQNCVSGIRFAGPLVLVLLASACDQSVHATANVLRLGNGPDPATLDPHRRQDEAAGHIVRDLFEGLVLEGPQGELRPGLAKRWTLLDEGRRIHFELRDDARWCNGDQLVADDVVAGLRRAVDPGTAAPFAELLAPIENAGEIVAGELPPHRLGVEILSPDRIEIRLGAPSPWLLRVLAHSIAAPVHRQSLAEHGDAYARPEHLLGNGAYCLTEVQRQSHVRLDRNPYHWDVQAHPIDTVYYYTIEDLDSELARYRADEIDVTVTVAPNRIAWVKANLAAELHEAPLLAAFYIAFNFRQPPFKDQAGLRRALNLALNREQLVDALFDGAAEPAYTLVPPMPNYATPLPEYADWPYPRRLAEARRLYEEAGYSSQNPLELRLMYPTSSSIQRQVTAVASLWREALGVRITLDSMEWKVFLATQQAGAKAGIYRDSWIADFADPVAFLQLFETGGNFNAYGFSEPAYDALLDSASTAIQPQTRMKALGMAEAELVASDAMVPMYFSRSRHLVKPRVKGWLAHPLDHHATRYLALTAPGEGQAD